MTTQTSTTGAELAHPGTWLPGDQITQPAGTIWERGVSDWGVPASTSSPRVTDDGMDAYLAASANARIVHLVPREDQPEPAPPTPPDTRELLTHYSEWLDSQGLIVSDRCGDDRPHDQLAKDFLTPEPEPVWMQISEDRDQPTLAKVTLTTGSVLVGEFYTNGTEVTRADTGFEVAYAHCVTHVEPLTTGWSRPVPDGDAITFKLADSDEWSDDVCCVCGSEDVAARGLYLLADGSLGRTAWCSDPECLEDRAGTNYLPTPERLRAALAALADGAES